MSKDLRLWVAEGLAQPGRTQRGLAKILGVHPARISRIVSGQREMRPDEVQIAARYFGNLPPDGRETEAAQSGCFDLPEHICATVRSRSSILGIEPEEFVIRAVQAALIMSAPNEAE